MFNAYKPEEAIGDPEKFAQKFAWLRKKWCERQVPDSVESRLISPMLVLKTSPINLSVIADNLPYFEKHYKENEMDSEALLQKACLCGSSQVANFLLKKLGLTYTSKGYEYILIYVSASKNIAWISEVASAMAEAGKKVPLDVYRLANYETIDRIKEIFEDQQNKQKATKQPS